MKYEDAGDHIAKVDVHRMFMSELRLFVADLDYKDEIELSRPKIW